VRLRTERGFIPFGAKALPSRRPHNSADRAESAADRMQRYHRRTPASSDFRADPKPCDRGADGRLGPQDELHADDRKLSILKPGHLPPDRSRAVPTRPQEERTKCCNTMLCASRSTPPLPP
jgi:hypothetical protein